MDMEDIMVSCWLCSYEDHVARVPLKEFSVHNSEYHSDCTYKCEICPNVFPSSEDLNTHINEDHGNFVCTGCFERYGIEMVLARDSFGEHYSEHHQCKKIKCNRCPNRFQLDRTYQEHRDEWHMHVPRALTVKIMCLNCKDGYSAERDQLELHNAAKHNKKHYPYQCEKCGNVFKRSADCDEHYKGCNIRTFGVP